jgi:hypothetical protein
VADMADTAGASDYESATDKPKRIARVSSSAQAQVHRRQVSLLHFMRFEYLLTLMLAVANLLPQC